MTSLQSWIQKALSQCQMSPKVEAYAMGRGASEESLSDLRVRTWTPYEEEVCPDPGFARRYGAHGEGLTGFLVAPYYAPWGAVMGFEARRVDRKVISDVRAPAAKRWCPIFLGLTPQAMRKIWEGSAVWLTEGLFDMFALQWVVNGVVLATVTANLSRSQTRFLARYMNNRVHIVYDRDKPGQEGSEKASYWLSRHGIDHEVVSYRGGTDPGEIWDKGGQRALKEAFWHVTTTGERT